MNMLIVLANAEWWWFLVIVLIFAAIAGVVFLATFLYKKYKKNEKKEEVSLEDIAKENLSKYLEDVEDEKTIEEMNKYKDESKEK